MRVLIFGGRDFALPGTADRVAMFLELDALHAVHDFTCVIEGEAKGADLAAREWAVAKRIPTQRFHADWRHLGRSAGVQRNLQMLREGKPEMAVEFPGGRGTAHMRQLLIKAQIPVATPWAKRPTTP